MIGMDRTTGKPQDGIAHLRQSIADILTTPIGSRVMRREYGSLLPELIDQPQNDATTVRLYSAVTSALMRWEPRLQRLSRLSMEHVAPGQSVLDIEGELVDGGALALQVPLLLGAVT